MLFKFFISYGLLCVRKVLWFVINVSFVKKYAVLLAAREQQIPYKEIDREYHEISETHKNGQLNSSLIPCITEQAFMTFK